MLVWIKVISEVPDKEKRYQYICSNWKSQHPDREKYHNITDFGNWK